VIASASKLENLAWLEEHPLGKNSLTLAFDLSRVQELSAFLEAQSDAHPCLRAVDILINNAGIYLTAELEKQTLDSWRNVFQINLDSCMIFSQYFLAQMKERSRGRIVNIGSVSGSQGEAWGAAYSASKFALLGLTQSLALETARYGVTVNAVCPGWVWTDLSREQIESSQWCQLNNLPPEQSVDLVKFSVPQERYLQPLEIANLVLYLSTQQAQGITGQAINICGGLSIHG
jgi:NAD(P)-dependent dehydrogenase (short-subunit alcohol dehydrogenase family)